MHNSVGFIGSGNIASAIIAGAIKSGYIMPNKIYIYDLDVAKSEKLSIYGINVCETTKQLLDNCQFVFLTVKPQVYGAVLNEIKPFITAEKCLVDVGAGVTIKFVKDTIGFDCKVIRVMPNTPLMYSMGATALVKELPVSDDDFEFIKGFFDANGITCVVKEDLIDAITGVSGSSPAFVFRFAREMIRAAVDNSMPADDAKKMVLQTILGSVIMMQQSELSLDELIKMVASPNGTTEAGLKSMDETNFDGAVYNAVDSAVKRSHELKR